MPSAVVIKNLHKDYGSTHALRGVDLEIPQGEFFGLLGPNGAGKTTLIQSIVGLVRPTSGEALIFGHSVLREQMAAKALIGFSPQEVNVDRFFNLRKTLEFQGGFYGLSRTEAKKRAEELLVQFNLSEKAKFPFYKLSGGMQRRLLIARALMSKPRLLILDEPTAGVDVEQRHELWAYLRNLNQSGTTIILTTHYIDEAEALCERIGVIDHGLIIELGSPEALIQKYCHGEVEIMVEGELTENEFNEIPNLKINGNKISAATDKIGTTTEKILSKILSKPGRRVLDINVKRGNLEEVFIRLTGKSIAKEQVAETK